MMDRTLSKISLLAFAGAVLLSANVQAGTLRSASVPIIKNTTWDINGEFVNFASVVKDGKEFNCLGFETNWFWKLWEESIASQAKELDVGFYFSSRKHPDGLFVPTTKVSEYDENWMLNDVDFDISRDTFIITHGFMSSGDEDWIKEMKDVLLKYKDANVLATNWRQGNNVLNYIAAAEHTKNVGDMVANMLLKLKGMHEGKRGKLHLIGHSLGSHISGRAAYTLKENQKGSSDAWLVDRVTGLDPAQPCFQTKDDSLKLAAEDAPYVDVIHTNARLVMQFGFGLPDPIGHTDFYPNGGKGQLGCKPSTSGWWNSIKHALTPEKIEELEESMCDHGRSHEYFTETINNMLNKKCSFFGRRWNCEDKTVIHDLVESTCGAKEVCPIMGLQSIDTYPTTQGTFFVAAGSSEPRCDITEDDKQQIIQLAMHDGMDLD